MSEIEFTSLDDLKRDLARMVGEPVEQPAPPLPEAQIATLQEFFAVYRRADRFKPGDIVTPRSGTNSNGEGDPHIVLEIQPGAEPFTGMDRPGSTAFGRRHDMRVLCWASGEYIPFWVESWGYEPYRPAAD